MIVLDTNIVANGATSQYGCPDINSMTKFAGKHLCASPDGLYELTGPDDDGVDIGGYFKTPMMHFGLSNEKRLRFVYVKYEANAEVSLTIETERELSKTYTLPSSSDLQCVHRVTVSRALHGSYWQFKFSGASFTIDEVSVLPIIRGHKIVL